MRAGDGERKGRARELRRGESARVPLFRGMSLRQRLQVILVALVCVVLGLAAVTLRATLQWQKAEKELQDHHQRSLLLEELRAVTFHAFKEVPEAILSRDPEARLGFDVLLEKAERSFQRWAELAHTPSERAQVRAVRGGYDAVVRHAHEIFGLVAAGRLEEATRMLEQQIEGEDFATFERVSAEAVESDREFFRSVQQESSRTRELAQIALGGASFVVIGLVVVLGYYFIAGLFRPLRAVETALEALGRGEMDLRIANADLRRRDWVRGQDELGTLVDAFNRTVEELGRTTVSMGYLDSIIESMVEALVVTTPEGAIRMANPAAGALLGFRREEIVGQPIGRFFPDQALGPMEPSRHREVRVRSRSGVEIPVSLSCSVVRASDGKVLGMAWVAQDITDRKRAEQQIQGALEEKEVLFKEIHHRVKNNLQVISSLLNLHTREVTDPGAVRTLQESRNRIEAMALVHEMLYRTETPSRMHLGDYLQSLTEHLMESYGGGAGGVRLESRLEPIALSLEAAIPCGLIINELVTNSLKHAFPPGRGGEIRIELSRTDRERAVLRVRDTGVGFPKDLRFEEARTLGLRLVRTLVEQLGGNLVVEPGPGAGLSIDFDISGKT